MKKNISRRQLLRLLSAAGLGSAFASYTVADETGSELPQKSVVPEGKLVPNANYPFYPAQIVNGKVIQPERGLPIYQETDVLVVGGGPAGFAAAISAARAGVKTTIIERYGYFGGQWTGGLVLLVISTHAKENGKLIQVMQGIGGDLLERLSRYDEAIVNYGPGKFNPTTDPEATKYVMDEMVQEAGVKVLFHCWVANVILNDNQVRGVVFESKSGRQAVLAKVVVDATGDGDIFAAAGAEHEQRLHAIGLVHRLGNYDRTDLSKLQEAGIKSLGAIEPLPSVRWVNLRGPSTDALDIAELSRLEIAHRKSIWKRVQQLRKKPGGEKLFLLQAAPQLGVRITRLLGTAKKLTFAEAMAGRKFADTIGVGGAQNAHHAGWPIPYGTLVPKRLDGLLAAGRCINVDEKLIEDMRLIAPCLTTGHAAGAAAALAVRNNCRPRDVGIADLQKLLTSQGAFLG